MYDRTSSVATLFVVLHPVFLGAWLKAPSVALPHSALALIHDVHHCALVRSHHLLDISTALVLGDEVSIHVVLIDWLALPRYHVAIIQVILIGTPLQVLCSVVGLNLILMIDDQSFFVTWNKMESHEAVNFIMCVVAVPVAQTDAIIAVSFV